MTQSASVPCSAAGWSRRAAGSSASTRPAGTRTSTASPAWKNDLIPPADRAFAALVTDLEQRGLLDSTLVVMMGEMGRTPRVNAQAGRDHWSMAQSVLFAGGGTKPGQVIGATDKQAAAPTERPGQRRRPPATPSYAPRHRLEKGIPRLARPPRAADG